MPYSLVRKSQVEQQVQKQLRDAVIKELKARQLTNREVADLLDLLPSGAETLLSRNTWPIEISLRVAESLQMNVKLQAG